VKGKSVCSIVHAFLETVLISRISAVSHFTICRISPVPHSTICRMNE
jgi:hypothetical protein